MIVRTLATHYRLITQNDHAHWAYQLLSLWPQLANHPRRSVILEATRLHDRGWQGVDASPLVQPSGAPHDFRSLPMDHRQTVWRSAVGNPNREAKRPHTDLSGEHHPQVNGPDLAPLLAHAWRELLICHHACTIHRAEHVLPPILVTTQEPIEPSEARSGLVAMLTEHRKQRMQGFTLLLEEQTEKGDQPQNQRWPDLHAIEDTLESDYRWIGALDILSLVASSAWEDELRLLNPAGKAHGELTARCDSEGLVLNPFPLKGTYSLPLRSRDIPLQSYPTNTSLAMALARAAWQNVEIRVRREAQ